MSLLWLKFCVFRARCPGVWLGRSDRWADDSYNAISPLSPPALSIPLLHGKPQTCPGQLSPLRWLAFYVFDRFVLVQEFAAAGAEVTGDESHWRLITAEHHTAAQVPQSRLRTRTLTPTPPFFEHGGYNGHGPPNTVLPLPRIVVDFRLPLLTSHPPPVRTRRTSTPAERPFE